MRDQKCNNTHRQRSPCIATSASIDDVHRAERAAETIDSIEFNVPSVVRVHNVYTRSTFLFRCNFCQFFTSNHRVLCVAHAVCVAHSYCAGRRPAPLPRAERSFSVQSESSVWAVCS